MIFQLISTEVKIVEAAIMQDQVSSSRPTCQQLVMLASSNLPAIDKLEGESNWANWKYLMQLYLGLDDRYDCVLQEPPEHVQQNLHSSEMKRDLRARLQFSVEKFVRSIQRQKRDPVHQPHGPAFGHKTRKHQVIKPIDDEFVAFFMLRSLRLDYKCLRQLIKKSIKKEELTPDMRVRRRQRKKGGVNKSSKALLAGAENGRNFSHSGLEQSTRWQPGNCQERAPEMVNSSQHLDQHQQRVQHQPKQTSDQGGQQGLRSGRLEAMWLFATTAKSLDTKQPSAGLRIKIYNADESGLFWRMLPNKTLADLNEKVAPGKKELKQGLHSCRVRMKLQRQLQQKKIEDSVSPQRTEKPIPLSFLCFHVLPFRMCGPPSDVVMNAKP
ncbi:hypothetical protein J437_LFUL013865 [Ladona fulva]|uniref:DUF4219 domain-containing protein n=1 Tax=Ladona fulva TaxID=123851 RepID=A0A8K0KHH3_LADFU|nr:hypothetical protein J437_LFUL013865 [Ladona fulva]